MDSCMRAYSTVQQLLCHGGYCELILSLARTSCRLLITARPTARPRAGNPLRDVRSRNPSKSTLAHDAVGTVSDIVWIDSLMEVIGLWLSVCHPEFTSFDDPSVDTLGVCILPY